MKVERLELQNFRSYQKVALDFDREVTVFSGENAKGKTNLLEAIFLCCTARSHRTPRDRELIHFGSESAQIVTAISRLNGKSQIKLQLSEKGRKKAWVGGAELPRIGELLGVLNGVMFSPEDLRLVKDGPDVRRRFLDISLSQISPLYFNALSNYQRALRQRNMLLRQLVEKRDVGQGDLDLWDLQLSRYGAQVAFRRAEWVARLCEAAQRIYYDISGGREHLMLLYQTKLDLNGTIEALQDELYTRIQKARSEDLRRATTTVGPHRDELELKIGETAVRTFGSQGQQRTSALSLKLAELRLMEEETGEAPILLLDDVMSELDDERQRLLLKHTSGVQTFIACTNYRQLPPMEQREMAVFEVGMHEGVSGCTLI